MNPVRQEKTVVHLIPAFSVTLKRQLSHAAAALVGAIGALLSMPVDSWLPHLSAILGPKAKDWGPFLIAVAFFWNALMKGKDAHKLHYAEKTEQASVPPIQPLIGGEVPLLEPDELLRIRNAELRKEDRT